jgi:hypothetical protein
MNDDTARRLSAIYTDILAGTSPLTNQDVMEAIIPGMIPVDAPALDADPFAQFLREHIDEEQGTRAAAVSWEVVLATLEDRLKRKQDDRR